MATAEWGLLLAIEVLGLLAILTAMIMLMTRGASFKQPAPYGPPPGYGPPGSPPPTGHDGLPQVPPTPGWPT